MKTSRRHLLKTAAAGAGLAFVPGLLRTAARAATPQSARRLVVFYTGQGHHADHFLPTGSGGTFTLAPGLAALAPHQAKTLVLHNLLGSSGHYEGHAECLTGRPNGDSFTAAGGPSVDQLLAERLRTTTPLPSLELGVQTGANSDGMIAYAPSGLPLPAALNPHAAFDRMFRTINEDPAVAARRRVQGLSVLDSVAADLVDLQSVLTPDGRRLLDAHLTLVRQQEVALMNPPPVTACDLGPGTPAPMASTYSYPEAVRYQIDNIVAALACDVTRVATLVVGYAQDTTVHNWLGHTEDFHEIAHGNVPDALSKMLQIEQWHAQQFAYLLSRLDGIPDAGGGTLLDSCAVMWTTELGVHTFDHSRENTGVVLAGGACGYFNTGRAVDMQQAHYHDVLLTLCHAMGATDVPSFGANGTTVLTPLLA